MKTRLKLLQDWEGNKAGTIVGLDKAEDLAYFVDSKIGEEYKTETPSPDDDLATRVKILVADAVADSQAKAPKVPPVISGVHERIEDDPKHGFKGFGEFVSSVHKAQTDKGIDKRLLIKAPSGLGETTDSDGGFLVPDEYRAELLRRTYDSALVASRARAIPINHALQIPYLAETSRADGSRGGGVRGYWVDEVPASGITASAPTFGKLQLNLHKVAALVYASDDLLGDSVITMDALINSLVSDELAFQIDDKFINGTGAGTPVGLLNANCTVSVSKETGQAATTVVSENILKMWARLYSRSKGSAVWFINQDVSPQLYSMTMAAGTAGVVTFMPPGGLSGAPYATLMGRPVIEIEQAATLGTVGDIILADMSQYIWAQKAGESINAVTSIHVRFIYDETAFRFTMRADGQPWWSAALTPYKGTSNTVSPFITLASRA